MIDYAALAALAAVLRTGSFDGAAADLGLTQSAVSQRIRSLEDRMGATLLRRTRPPEPTEPGRRLLRHAEEVGLLEQALSRDLGALLPRRNAPLRIAVTADSLATFVLPALAEVRDYLFDLVIDDQEFSADLLQGGEVAAAVTTADASVTGCDAIPLLALDYVAFAAPDFVARWFRDGITPEALAVAPAITFNRKDRLQRLMAEQATGRKVALPTHYIGSTRDITSAAVAGLGWAVNPVTIVQPFLRSGALVNLFPGQVLKTPLVWQVLRRTAPALMPLTRAMRRAATDLAGRQDADRIG
jgi:LysR family transcriptional regulator (chromosome initiation inhibitor)